MISKETENVQSSEEIENAFRAITSGAERQYVTKEELYAVSLDTFGNLCIFSEIFNFVCVCFRI